jgi:hypothetical protein
MEKPVTSRTKHKSNNLDSSLIFVLMKKEEAEITKISGGFSTSEFLGDLNRTRTKTACPSRTANDTCG